MVAALTWLLSSPPQHLELTYVVKLYYCKINTVACAARYIHEHMLRRSEPVTKQRSLSWQRLHSEEAELDAAIRVE